MENRRDFLKKILMAAGAAGVASLPDSVQRAFAIEPEAASTFLDAEHVVLLMQENRSFDHAFGTLRGVRGFNDPRAITLPNKNKVWLQTNAAGETYTPFRLDIKDTKSTWMGDLPHGRKSQVDARNGGRHDNWLNAKKSGNKEYAKMPLTLGYYTREDIPFYYALADAFTVCDQNFCSVISQTNPNRVHFWTGTCRSEPREDSRAYMDNGSIEREANWRTFPELLETAGISWKMYQNEIDVEGGFSGEEGSWLANFGDNTMEYFPQYNVKLSKRYIDYLPAKIVNIGKAIETLEVKIAALPAGDKGREVLEKQLKNQQNALAEAKLESEKLTPANYEKLSPFHKALHEKAFVVNSKDPDQHNLTPLKYDDGGTEREINVPKGDVLHQFREDVRNGKLPTVSWLVPAQNFSDHPSAAWFGSWYLSEVIDILTENPEVWKKTIFILTYDENDGYFDHVPTFIAPDHRDPSTGKVSPGVDISLEYVRDSRDVPAPIGLGFRVPMVVASPWTRGGWVNSQVFDHTSTIAFLEGFLNKKFGKNIRETNISSWRRTVCGDLTSVFRESDSGKVTDLPFLKSAPFIAGVHKAKFKNVPANFKALNAGEIAAANNNPKTSPYVPDQEKGTKPSCAIPYELHAGGNLSADKKSLQIDLAAGKEIFKERSAGSPFIVYSHNYQGRDFTTKNYTAAAGTTVSDEWLVSDFKDGRYDLRIYGPNGFFRQLGGDAADPTLKISLQYSVSDQLTLNLENTGKAVFTVQISDNAYSFSAEKIPVQPGVSRAVPLDLKKSFGWYDLKVTVDGATGFERIYAGRMETGKHSSTDPAMA